MDTTKKSEAIKQAELNVLGLEDALKIAHKHFRILHDYNNGIDISNYVDSDKIEILKTFDQAKIQEIEEELKNAREELQKLQKENVI